MSGATGLFRESAVRAAEHRWFSAVLIVTPPTAVPALFLALLALGSLLLAAVLIEVPERVRTTGVLLPAGGLLQVRARRSGWVDKLSVRNGEMVSTGAALLWLTDTASAPERAPEIAARLMSLRSELRLSEIAESQEIMAGEQRQLVYGQRAALLGRQLLAAHAEFEIRSRHAALQAERAARLAVLAAGGALAAHSAEDLAAAALQAQAASQAARQHVLGLEAERLLLQQQTAADTASQGLLRTNAALRREAIRRDIAETELRSATVVAAPGDGVAVGVAVRDGSYVQSGEVLLTLHDPADPLEARLYVAANNAAMIATGQRVELQLNAYPKQLFGTQSAVITSISAAALAAHEVDAVIPLPGPVFEIRAALDATAVEARGTVWNLPPGTVVAADLVRRRWPLYRWLLRAAARDTGSA